MIESICFSRNSVLKYQDLNILQNQLFNLIKSKKSATNLMKKTTVLSINLSMFTIDLAISCKNYRCLFFFF